MIPYRIVFEIPKYNQWDGISGYIYSTISSARTLGWARHLYRKAYEEFGPHCDIGLMDRQGKLINPSPVSPKPACVPINIDETPF